MSRISWLIVFIASCTALFVIGFCNGPTEAEGRNLCQRPVYMMTTQSCNRVPTSVVPYCKPTGY